MAWYNDEPSPWQELLGDPAPTLEERVIAAAKQVAEDNEAMASMSTDHAEGLAHQRVAEAFESFARMLETGEHR